MRARRGELVEIGCLGGSGRTGTVLACMAVLAGVPPAEAVDWVRTRTRPKPSRPRRRGLVAGLQVGVPCATCAPVGPADNGQSRIPADFDGLSGAEALARRIVETALDESAGVKGASLGLRLIDAIDPPVEASVTVELPKTPEDIDAMPYDDHAFAQLATIPGISRSHAERCRRRCHRIHRGAGSSSTKPLPHAPR